MAKPRIATNRGYCLYVTPGDAPKRYSYIHATHSGVEREAGFALIELMIVIAIIGILAAIAVPTFLSYRNKSRVALAVATSESIRAAVASYAADSPNNLYPLTSSIGATYNNLRAIAKRPSGNL